MDKQRIRYQWFRDVPRNVTVQEYNQWHLRMFGAIGFGAMSIVMAIAVATGMTLTPTRELAAVKSISLADALSHKGDRLDLVKLEGFLIADQPLTMPDDPARKVIRGQIKLLARSSSSGENEPIRETLYEWEDAATTVFLSDGDRQLPLAFDLAVIPMVAETKDFDPNIIRQGDSARTSKPVAVEYNDQVFKLAPETWGEIDSVFVDLERQVLPQGQAVVIVASLEPSSEGNRLNDPLGDRLKVMLGTETEIEQQGKMARRMFAFLCIPTGIASLLLGRSANRLHQEFVERSNQ